MTEQATQSERYTWRRYGVKLPAEIAGEPGLHPMDVTDTGPRDVLLGLACYGFLCGGLGFIVAWAMWGPK